MAGPTERVDEQRNGTRNAGSHRNGTHRNGKHRNGKHRNGKHRNGKHRNGKHGTHEASVVEQLVELGAELNANQYRAVHLAARYDHELEWRRHGLPSAAVGIARRLGLHASTVREWIRVGHCLIDLPAIDAAFRANEVSYAKVRILTRWADPDTELELLAVAGRRPANRLTAAIAQHLALDDDDGQRDQRHHDQRTFTSYTDGDGMVVIRVVLPPSSAKPVVAAIDELVKRIAATPAIDESFARESASAASDEAVSESAASDEASDASADGSD